MVPRVSTQLDRTAVRPRGGGVRARVEELERAHDSEKASLPAQLDQVQIPLNACDDSYLTALAENQRLVDELQNLIPLYRKSDYNMGLRRLQMAK